MRGSMRRLKIHLGDPIRPSADEQLDIEFAFTSWADNCRVPQLTEDGDFPECRRRLGHEGWHASGYGAGRIRWP